MTARWAVPLFLSVVTILTLLPALPALPAQEDHDAGKFAREVFDVREANLALLSRYQWKSKTEVAVNGITVVLVDRVHVDESGKRVHDASGEAVAARSREEREMATAAARDFQALVRKYTEPEEGPLVRFFQQASFKPGEGALSGAIQVAGKDVFEPGDQARLWLHSETLRPFRYEFSATLDGKPVTGEVEVGVVPGGPFYAQRTVIRDGAGRVMGSTRNYDLEDPNATAVSDPSDDEANGAGEAGEAGEAGDGGDEDDPGWPRVYKIGKRQMTAFEPQIDSWENYRKLECTLAVAVEWKGAPEPVYGVMRLSATTDTDFDERTVLIGKLKVIDLAFPELQDGDRAQVEETIRKLLPRRRMPFGLDRMLAAVEEQQRREDDVELSLDPPDIIVSERRAALVTASGDPLWEPIDGAGLEYALNTEWDLFRDTSTGQLYLHIDDRFAEAGRIDGVWVPCAQLPPGFKKLPNERRWEDVRADAGQAQAPPRMPPLYLRTMPAELVILDGAPAFSPIANTGLLDVKNTESDLFFHVREKEFYLLIAGRWFRTANLKHGPWEYAGEDLPEDFANITPDHSRSDVLASVPGTPEADEAVMLSQIPRTARVERHSPDVEVTYDGQPLFEEIEGTSLRYAVNTSFDVIQLDSSYFLCHEGIWFVSSSPLGPWKPTVEVPDEIYEIPSSCPVHHVVYVRVYDHDDDYVYYGYTGGYLGYYYYGGYLCYGLGYWRPYPRPYYRHWHRHVHHHWRHHHRHPCYRARSYGHGAHYNRATASYGHRYRAGSARRGQYSNRGVYAGWGGKKAGVERTRRGAIHGTTRAPTGVRRSGRNVYAGKDGSVYRRWNGRWQKRSGRQWNDVPRSTGRGKGQTARSGSRNEVNSGLDKHRRVRKSGHKRTQRHKRYKGHRRSGYGHGRGGGGYRGGARRGGGGFRGGGRR